MAKNKHAVSALYLQQAEKLNARDTAIYRFAEKLSVTPATADAADMAALRAAGMSDAEIIDLIHSIAIFGWANRLMHVLGHADIK